MHLRNDDERELVQLECIPIRILPSPIYPYDTLHKSVHGAHGCIKTVVKLPFNLGNVSPSQNVVHTKYKKWIKSQIENIEQTVTCSVRFLSWKAAIIVQADVNHHIKSEKK